MTTALATVAPVKELVAKLQRVRDVLATTESLPDVKAMRDKAEAVREYCKAAKYGAEVQNFAAIVKIEAEIRAGQILADDKELGSGKSSRLELYGINKQQSHRWQQMAAVDDEDLTGLIDSCNASNREITSAAVLKLAKKNVARKPMPVSDSDAEGVTDSLDALIADGLRFKTVYADPPWQYSNQATRASTDNHYGTMTVEAIAKLPVDLLADEQSILFLWTTNGFLFESKAVIDAWGFEFKSSMVWVKPQMGIGNYVRNAHEFLLIATRGGAMPTDACKTQMSWLNVPRGKHSAKPNAFRKVVEALGEPNRLELFGRSKADGWTVFGNQISETLL